MCIRTTFLFFILTAGSQQISIYRSFLSVYLCCFFACQIKFFLQLQCKLKILFFLICSFLYELWYSKIANITGCGTWWNNKILSVCISIFAVIQCIGLVSVLCRACKQTRYAKINNYIQSVFIAKSSALSSVTPKSDFTMLCLKPF